MDMAEIKVRIKRDFNHFVNQFRIFIQKVF